MSSCLYIEDDIQLAQIVKEKLTRRCVVDIAGTAETGIEKAIANTYDLIILDFYLPDGTGLDVCETLRDYGVPSCILFLTKESNKYHTIQALDSGADDYLTKPFHFDEFQARIRALLRRFSQKQQSLLTAGSLTLDPKTQKVWIKDHAVTLRYREFLLLQYLLLHKNHIISRSQLLEHVWGKEFTDSNTIEVHIRRLRQKIEKPYKTIWIQSVYGLGYKMLDSEIQ